MVRGTFSGLLQLSLVIYTGMSYVLSWQTLPSQAGNTEACLVSEAQ